MTLKPGDDEPVSAEYLPVEFADLRFTVKILYESGGVIGLSTPGPPPQPFSSPAGAEPETRQPSVSMDLLREIASHRIETAVERLFADRLGGLDLGPLVSDLSAVDELARAMAAGIAAGVYVGDVSAGLGGSGSASQIAGTSGGVFAPASRASAFPAASEVGFSMMGDPFPPNQYPPVAQGEYYAVPHDRALGRPAPGVLANDYDPDGNDIFAVLDTPPGHAEYFELNPDGSFVYVPDYHYVGQDAFTYYVTDGVFSSGRVTTDIEVFNTAPMGVDDLDYTTSHRHGLQTWASNGVLVNDFDAEADPLTAVLDSGPSHALDFQLDPDGGFYYEPDPSFVGYDSFSYHPHDEIADGSVATVRIEVTNQAPQANDDYYQTDAETPLVVDAPGVLENDSDLDGDPLTAVLQTGPSHGTLEYFNLDGSFKYVPSGGLLGTDQFTYYANDGLTNSDTPATVHIDVGADVELTIFNGGVVPIAVPDDVEVSQGAFTVANLNDTDGDEKVDAWDYDGVIAIPEKGRDEVDLMQLIVHSPVPDVGGSLWLTVSDPTNVRLWEESTKVNEIVMDMYGELEFLTSQLPKTLWVELTSPSNSLRDVQIDAYYEDAGDSVTATGIWASLTTDAHDNATYAELVVQSPWSELVPGEPPQPFMEDVGGTGLRRVPTEFLGVDSVLNSMWMSFTVSPPGIQDVQYVNFDVTRRVESRIWKLDAQKSVIPPTVHEENFPPENEEANDDTMGETDESHKPNANQHMFVVDAPGVEHDWLLPGPEYCVYRFNAEEFVRFAYGVTVEGNGWHGSRCSSKFKWHVNHTLKDDGSGHWMRDITGANDVGPGPLNVPVEDSNPWDDP